MSDSVDLCSLVPKILRGGGKRAWYTLFAHVPNSICNLRTTLLHWNYGPVCLPAERQQCRIILPVRHIMNFWSQEQYRFDGNTLHRFIWGNHSKLQRNKKDCWFSVTAFGWNGRTHGQFLQAKNWVLMSLHCHCMCSTRCVWHNVTDGLHGS